MKIIHRYRFFFESFLARRYDSTYREVLRRGKILVQVNPDFVKEPQFLRGHQ